MGENVRTVGGKIASQLRLLNRSNSQAKWQRLDLRGLDKHPNLSATGRLSQTVTNVWSFVLQLAGKNRQHFGPRSRAPDLWPRHDLIQFSVNEMKLLPSVPEGNMINMFTNVGVLEERIGYRFKDKMLAVEALRISKDAMHLNGVTIPIIKNNRLALMGDRILAAACCDIWYKSGRTTAEYNAVEARCVSRVTLNLAGRYLQLEDLVFLGRNSIARNDVVAETFEAFLGAVYTDSNKNIDTVIGVLHTCGFVKNFLQVRLDELLDSQKSPAATTPSVASLERQSESRDNPSVESDALQGAQTGDEMFTTTTLVRRKHATRRRKYRRRAQRQITFRPAPATSAARPKPDVQPASAAQPKSAVESESRFETATAQQDLIQQLRELRTMIQAESRVESNLASQQPLQSLEQLKASIESEPNHYNSANSLDAPSPISDDTATVISKTEETVDHVQFSIEGLAQPEDSVSLESASILNSRTLAVLYPEERNSGIQFVEEALSPPTAYQTHPLPQKSARYPMFSTSSCPYYQKPRPSLPPLQSQAIHSVTRNVLYPVLFARKMQGDTAFNTKLLWRSDSILDDVETIWPYPSDTAELHPAREPDVVATNAKAEDAPAETKATSTEAELVSEKLTPNNSRVCHRKLRIALRNCLLNIANSGYGPLQTAAGAMVSSYTEEVDFEELLKASEAKAHIVAAMGRISAREPAQEHTALSRQALVDLELSKKIWRGHVAKWFVRAPDPELREVLAARMVAYVIARWQYMYPLPEKPTLLAHFRLAKRNLNQSLHTMGRFTQETPENDMDIHSLVATGKNVDEWFPDLGFRSHGASTRITWILGSDQSRLEEIIGPLEDLDVHRYLIFRAVEQFLKSDIRSRYPPNAKPDDTNPDKSNFDSFKYTPSSAAEYTPSSATTEFDGSKSDSPKFDSPESNESRSDMHRIASNEFDDIFVSTLTMDLSSHDNPQPVIPESSEPSSGSPDPASPKSDSTVASAPTKNKKKKEKKKNLPGSNQRRKILKHKLLAEAVAAGLEQSQTPPSSAITTTPTTTTTLQVRRVVDNVSPPLEMKGEKRGPDERVSERTKGREMDEGKVKWYPAR